jgi:hypothetical protein
LSAKITIKMIIMNGFIVERYRNTHLINKTILTSKGWIILIPHFACSENENTQVVKEATWEFVLCRHLRHNFLNRTNAKNTITLNIR